MAIIVEIKSKKSCCRESNIVLTEQQASDVLGFLSGEKGGNIGAAIRTTIAKQVVEMFVPASLESFLKEKKLYNVFVNTVSAIDLDQVLALVGKGENKRSACENVAEVVLQGLEKTMIGLVSQKLRDFRADLPSGDDSPFLSIFSDLAGLALSGGALATNIAGAIFTENTKDSLNQQIADQLCDIDYEKMFGDVFGQFGGAAKFASDAAGDVVDFFKQFEE
jgi:uncharacterized membrane protein|tara:strand:+ start:506 stop:1168 length:663 start_codon:yes stop_codon:yes gene_type:complete